MAIDGAGLRATGTYRARLPHPQLTAELEEVDRTIRGWQGHRKRLNQIGFLLLPVGVLLLILGAVTGFQLLIALAIPMFFGAVALFIYSALYARDCCKRLHRLQLVRGLAAMAGEDAAAHALSSVDLSFRERKERLAEEPWPVRKKGKQSVYQDRWAVFEAELLDGTTLTEEVMDLIRERTYVNPRGKTKRKRRDRHIVSVRLAYPAGVYGDASQCPAKLVQGLRVPPSSRLQGCKVTGRDIKLRARVDRPDGLKETCVMLALGGYRILNYARAIQGGARGHTS